MSIKNILIGIIVLPIAMVGMIIKEITRILNEVGENTHEVIAEALETLRK